MHGEGAAGFGGYHATTGAHEEVGAEGLLELADLLRDRGLRDAEDLRGAVGQFLESQSYPAAVKATCSLVGDTTGPVRPPLLPLDDAATSELSALIDHATLAEAAR